MFEVHQTDVLFRAVIGVLSLLAAAHSAIHCPGEFRSLLRKHRQALGGRRAAQVIAGFALIAGLTITLSLPALYMLHGLEALAVYGTQFA